MTSYIELQDSEAESIIFETLQTLDATMRVGYARIGLMIREVERRSLWSLRLDLSTGLPFRSLTSWIRSACPYSYSTAFAAKSDVKELEEDLSSEDISQIPHGNLKEMLTLSTAVRKDPKVIQAAKTERSEEFIAMIQVTHPEQAKEHVRDWRVPLSTSQQVVKDEAYELGKERGHWSSPTQMVEVLTSDYLLEYQESVEAAQSVTARVQ